MDRQVATRTRLANASQRERISDLFDAHLRQRASEHPRTFEARFREILETVSREYPEDCPVLLCWRVWQSKWKETLALSSLGAKSKEPDYCSATRAVFNRYWTETPDIKPKGTTHRSLGARFCPRANRHPSTCCVLCEVRDQASHGTRTDSSVLKESRTGSPVFGTYDEDTGEVLSEPVACSQYISNRQAQVLYGLKPK